MNETGTKNPLLRQASGGFLWALFFVLGPLDLLVLGALVWIPVFVWREILRTRRYGFLLGALVRYPLIAGAVMLAAIAPTKYEDRRVGSFDKAEVTLGQLAASNVIYSLRYAQHEMVIVTLPSASPTRREVMHAIEKQNGFKASVFHCGVGATTLFGSASGRISVSEPLPENTQ